METYFSKHNIPELEEKLGYRFSKPEVLRQALMHSSYTYEMGYDRDACYERLEFLGDSVLGMMVALLIFNHTPSLMEGEMTKLRAQLVCEETLSKLALKLDLGSYLLLGFGEANSGGRMRPSILADAFESVLAAVYIDGGFEPAMQFVENIFSPYINKPSVRSYDYKTLLQELVQAKHGQSYTYELLSEDGPDHNKTFTIEAKLDGKTIGVGTGKTKKAAEQSAAKEAIRIMKEKY